MNSELTNLHARLGELNAAFHALPIEDRGGGPLDQPIRDEIIALHRAAEELLPPPELPVGFSWGHTVHEGEAVHGIRILPDDVTPPELWGVVIRFEDADTILKPHGLEVRPTQGDFFLIKIGSHLIRDVGSRIRLIGPTDGFERVANLFTFPATVVAK